MDKDKDKLMDPGPTSGNGKVVKKKIVKRMKLKRDAFFKKEEPPPMPAVEVNEEVEEGELGTLNSPPRREVENGEIVGDRWRGGKDEVEKGEILVERWRRGERSPRWRGGIKDEVEKGEFIPDRERWSKGDEYSAGYSKGRRGDRRYELEWTPPSVKYSGEDVSPGREFSRSGSRHSKRSARWEGNNQERSVSKMSSKMLDDYKNEYSGNVRNHGREHSHSSNNRLKRQGTDSDSSDRKGYDDYGDYVTSKSRRLSGEGARSVHSEHYSRQSVEKSFRNSSSSRSSVSDRLSMRNYDSSSTRAGYERYMRSPSYSERSPPRERVRYPDFRDRTPVRNERSPGSRGPRHERPSPSYSERSPHDRGRVYDSRDRSPSYSDPSPQDRGKPSNQKQTGKKPGLRENKQNYKLKEEKTDGRNSNKKDSTGKGKNSHAGNDHQNGTVEKSLSNEASVAEALQNPSLDGQEQPAYANGVLEELPSMEEDMDICDTPPHVPSSVPTVNPGKWYYIDHYGEEHGPSRLSELKALVEGGFLMSDHLVKHLDSDRWVTVENATSPVVTANFPTIFSDSVTQLVTPPEAPGNVLLDGGVSENIGDQASVVGLDDLADGVSGSEEQLPVKEDHGIDERVGALLEGFTVVPGKELEVVGEVLQMTFNQPEWDRFGSMEGIIQDHPCREELSGLIREKGVARYAEAGVKDASESTSTASFDKDCGYLLNEFTEWFSGRWTCKGGDWQRNDEGVQDKFFRKKIVLNDGYPLCQMPKSGFEDPRWHTKDDLYYPCQSRRLELPTWAFCWSEERSENNVVSKAGQVKTVLRGTKGTMMPVIRINACVVKDGSSVSDSRLKPRGKDKCSSKGTKHHSPSSDVKKLSGEDEVHAKSFSEQSSVGSWEPCVINKPKDRLCTVDDLQLHLGDWYYLDGAGYERGPFSCSGLQKLVNDGSLKLQSSVFRKMDKVWVPVSSVIKSLEDSIKPVEDNSVSVVNCFEAPLIVHGGSSFGSRSFNNLHPQFIGYTLGKLHELVMKSYKSREFAAAINEVLDPWLNSRQPKKEMERYLYSRSSSRGSLYKSAMEYELSTLQEDDMHARKRCRALTDGADEGYEVTGALPPVCFSDPSFEDLCGNVAFCKDDVEYVEAQVGSWGLLDGHVLAQIFHFLRADIKSLAFAASTCRHWRAAAGFYRNVSIRVDLSAIGPSCSDTVIDSIMTVYNRQKIKFLVLDGCINITSSVLEEILQSFSFISCIDIRGCSQFEDLLIKFPNVTWMKDRMIAEESTVRTKIMKQMAEQTFAKSSHGSSLDESSGLKDYFDMVEKRGAANQVFRQNLYKRTKICDTRKSQSVLAREARMRHWAMKKAGRGYRRMEEFLVLSLKDIMKTNSSDYLVHKVGEIENRVKSGYYARRGLSFAKQDIIKMCREATKIKNRGDGGDMEHVIALFIKLGTRLDESFQTVIERDDMTKKLRDEGSGCKRNSKAITEKKFTSRTNGTSLLNGGPDHVECSSEMELRKKLKRIYKKLDSDNESSDEYELSSDDTVSDGTSASDTASDSDIQSKGSSFESKEGYFTADEAFDFTPDDREWGARMTKASLVPPVTRKYEVIDQYVIVADEEEVRRKMRVSLPDVEKVKASRIGCEEVDMDFPEVKEYKPRKQLGEEVIEQEVYGIDPYTHNLLLDSIPEDVHWPLVERRLFVEDVILRVLNKQVRHYTGSGNTPMMYPLKPVIEEIMETAKQDNDIRTVNLCGSLVQAIDKRPEDNYVGYRKGLGVVCNKEGGFFEDDFVVEFLGEVYPAWRWFEKQDGIRALQKKSKEPAPEFYNIYLERPKGDASGYDLVVVDAMHKANYASRICHSCRPNCEAKVTAVSGQYQIGIYSVRPIGFGEEITFDYNSVTESKEEYEASVCLCGSQFCRGSYLNLTGEGAYEKVLKEWHGLLDRHCLLLEACELNYVSESDIDELGKAGLSSCLLKGLPDWLIAYSARLVRFINLERVKLPDAILCYNAEEKKKYGLEASVEMERSDAEVQAEGVYYQRLQNLALTLDKVRYVLRCVFEDPKNAPPPLQKLRPEEMVSALWNGEGSLVDELLDCMGRQVDDRVILDLKSKIHAHNPSSSGNVEKELRKSLLWLRDEVRDLNCTYKCRHDAAADVIHMYAYTKCFFKIREYKSVTSPPVYISPLDLGPKCAQKLSGVTEYSKTYGVNYCLGQLIRWYKQADANPDHKVMRLSRGCLALPDIGSFYARAQTPSRHRVYGPQTVRSMLARMERHPQKPWPKKLIWSFKHTPKIFGSPTLDAVMNDSPLDREMVNWLKKRPAIFQANWDR